MSLSPQQIQDHFLDEYRITPTTPTVADASLAEALIAYRRTSGQTLNQIAGKMGMHPDDVDAMEELGDGRLSAWQRYAEAVGVHVTLTIRPL